jgi:hypothetical protein
MFFRREKPKTLSFDDRVNALPQRGFQVTRKDAKAIVMRGRFASVVSESEGLGLTGYVDGNEIAQLVHGGNQVYFQTPSGKRSGATADLLKDLHAFTEDLREELGLVSKYNEGLGTVNGLHLYDRVTGRDAGHPKFK